MVTLKQYMQILQIQEMFAGDENKLNKEIIRLFKLDKLTKIESDEKIKEIISHLNSSSKLIKTFKINNIEFGFIPNLNEITVGEWVDIDSYQTRNDSFHKIMAILYRPIVNKQGNNYSIEEYEGTEKYEELMLDVDVQIFNSVMVFFWTLSTQLLTDLNTYILTETTTMMKNQIKMKEN